MVSYKFIIAALASHVLVATGAPTAMNSRSPQVDVFMCDGTEFRGECTTHTVQVGACTNVPSSEWNDRISSIENKDKDDFKCTWFLDADCQGETYTNQKDANLGDGNGQFDESITSYICLPK